MKNNLFMICKFLFLLILLGSFPALKGQLLTVSGYVSDVKTRETLIGATIQVKDKNKAAITDINGFFSIAGIRRGQHTLIISHLGYRAEEINLIMENKGIVLTDIHLTPRSEEHTSELQSR